jgi:hypothetical protein
LLNRAIAFIANHIGSSFGIAQIADASASHDPSSPSFCSRILTAGQGTKSAASASPACGCSREHRTFHWGDRRRNRFQPPAHLTNAFKKATGFTPRSGAVGFPQPGRRAKEKTMSATAKHLLDTTGASA